jgi:hypothetical protein
MCRRWRERKWILFLVVKGWRWRHAGGWEEYRICISAVKEEDEDVLRRWRDEDEDALWRWRDEDEDVLWRWRDEDEDMLEGERIRIWISAVKEEDDESGWRDEEEDVLEDERRRIWRSAGKEDDADMREVKEKNMKTCWRVRGVENE